MLLARVLTTLIVMGSSRDGGGRQYNHKSCLKANRKLHLSVWLRLHGFRADLTIHLSLALLHHHDFFFMPAVVTPGGNILSTLPVPLSSFGIESGMSMATPFIAGYSTLLLQVKCRCRVVCKIPFEMTANVVPLSKSVSSTLRTPAQQRWSDPSLRYSTLVTPGEVISMTLLVSVERQ